MRPNKKKKTGPGYLVNKHDPSRPKECAPRNGHFAEETQFVAARADTGRFSRFRWTSRFRNVTYPKSLSIKSPPNAYIPPTPTVPSFLVKERDIQESGKREKKSEPGISIFFPFSSLLVSSNQNRLGFNQNRLGLRFHFSLSISLESRLGLGFRFF